MRPSAFRKAAVAALVGVVAAASFAPAVAKPGKRQGPKPKHHKTPREVIEDHAPACTGNPAEVFYLDLLVNGVGTWGVYAMPAQRPKGIVVFAHGYGHTAESWKAHVSRVAKDNGVVAVAMDYRFQRDDYTTNPPTSRGWRVQEGAEDSIQAAQLFQRACPTASTIVMYGVSMGGHTAGLAVAAQAKRSNGKPLFDYLFDIEGVVNVTETYLEARALAPSGNTYIKNALADIEQEMGGTFEEKRDVYLDRTVVNRVDDIKASGVKGVVVVHAVDDGLAGYNQAPELVTQLRQAGVPVDVFTALTRGKGEAGTTLDGYVTSGHPEWPSPLAGHASETSTTHIVGAAGFDRLTALFRGVAPTCRVAVLDGETGHTAADPVYLPATC